MLKKEIAFIDLMAQKERLGSKLFDSVKAVIEQGHYIMGPQVKQLESQLAEFCGAKHVLSCSNGTDALAIILMAKNISLGDAVFVPSFTFAATAEVVAWLGAVPVFVDVLPDTFNMDPISLKRGIKIAQSLQLKPKAVISVDLFGQPADYDAIEALCAAEGLWLLSDAAQSFGASYKGRKVGTIGLATATSFYPAKPLGCYGDGGAIFTDDDELAEIMQSIRVHGQGKEKYDNVRIGLNGRMDTLQAAILLEKLSIFSDEIEARSRVAKRYNQGLQGSAQIPYVRDNVVSVWAQYTLCVPDPLRRDNLMQALSKTGIPSVVYYPRALHQQPAYQHYPKADSLKVSEALAQSVLSLPMHPYLTEETQTYIIEQFVNITKQKMQRTERCL